MPQSSSKATDTLRQGLVLLATLVTIAFNGISQSVPDLGRMTNSDMPEIAEVHARRLMQMAFDSLLRPIAGIFQRAYESGVSYSSETTLLAGAFVSVIASIHHLPAQFATPPKSAMADTLIDVFLYGLMSR